MIGKADERFDLAGKVAIVTGGAQGLGSAISLGLAQHGAEVSIVDLNIKKAEEAAHEIEKSGRRAIPLQCDVSDESCAKKTVERTIALFGKIDVLVANAGIGDRNPAERMTVQQWDRVISVNLRGVWLFDQLVGLHMIQRGEGGSIINMASIAGEVGLTTGNANYSASKGGVLALTRALAVEWAKHRIRVNAIAPVQFKTALVLDLLEKKPETKEYFLGRIPLGRFGELEDIVGPAVFLASSASAMITGITLNVDGGATVAF